MCTLVMTVMVMFKQFIYSNFQISSIKS
uniref:Uncharacterized protein n=1 Tax=Anguilla anguilla TaxID=7936 RepID=A0A0E9RL65_ANGAN